MAYLVFELITTLRDEGMLPPSDESVGATRLLATLNREQRGFLAVLLLSIREGFQVAHADVDAIAGTTRYRIPSRAIGAKLKLVTLLNGGSPITLYPMPYERQTSDWGAGLPGDFWLEGSTLVLRTPPNTPGTLRLTYYRRLGVLVEAEKAARITAINTLTQAVTLATPLPGSFSASSGTFDFIQANPHFDTLGASEPATRLANVLTFANALPAELAVGDYVTQPGETPICQAPLELHDVLALQAAWVTLSALGDPKASATKARLDDARTAALALLAPRIDDTPHVAINRNGPGWSRWWGVWRRR